MSIDNAQLWMQQHSHVIPALAVNHNEIVNIFEQEHQAHNLVQLSINDPGLSLALLAKVNTGRIPASGKEPIESPQSAISLLGEQVSKNLFLNTPVAETELKHPGQLSGFTQIINRCFHNKVQTESWAQSSGYQQLEPIKMAGLLAYTGELLCCTYDFDNYLKYLRAGQSLGSEQQQFGFLFDELSLAVGKKYNLPSLILRSLPIQKDNGQRSQLVMFLSQICRYCECGWYSEKMLETQQQFANYLKQPLDRVIRDIHQYAVAAARSSILPEILQPAARLILTKDHSCQMQLVDKENKVSSVDKIKLLIKNPQTTQSDILKTCVDGLHSELGLSKVCLLLISRDRKTLQSRMTVGANKDSKLHHYRIEIAKAGLFKILLNKPQAIWINNNTFARYQKLIPQSFLASIMTNNFFAMSLFINDKPVGFIYADHTDSSKDLTEEMFRSFKQLILLSSKALTLLGRKQPPAKT